MNNTLEKYKKAVEIATKDKVVEIKEDIIGAIARTTQNKVFCIYDTEDINNYVDDILLDAEGAESGLIGKLNAWEDAMEEAHLTKEFRILMKETSTPDEYKTFMKIKHYKRFWYSAANNDILGICAMVGLKVYNADAVKQDFISFMDESDDCFAVFTGEDAQKTVQLTDNEEDEEFFTVFRVEVFEW